MRKPKKEGTRFDMQDQYAKCAGVEKEGGINRFEGGMFGSRDNEIEI